MQSGRHVDFCQVQLKKEVVSINDHRFLAMFDSHQELCVPGAGLCISSSKLCLSCAKFCAISVLVEVVLFQKNTTSQMCPEFMKLFKKQNCSRPL